jgi:hypothetical protein
MSAWYDQVVSKESGKERDEFVRGMFGFNTHNQHKFIAGLLAGYFGTQAIFKADKYRDDSRD